MGMALRANTVQGFGDGTLDSGGGLQGISEARSRAGGVAQAATLGAVLGTRDVWRG